MALFTIKPPRRGQLRGISIFLGGSIEMGKAEDWQLKLINRLASKARSVDITALNPRRDSWSRNWKQSIHNPHFCNQVHWELDHIELADLVLLNFCKDTLSPISLLELGKCSELKPKQTIVCAPSKFWRRGNIEVVCCRGGIPLFTEWKDAVKALFEKMGKLK